MASRGGKQGDLALVVGASAELQWAMTCWCTKVRCWEGDIDVVVIAEKKGPTLEEGGGLASEGGRRCHGLGTLAKVGW